jgi:anaerobic selenocysteine-containing dehydrogenase
VNKRPQFMYHAWGSHNDWMRKIERSNILYLHPDTAARHGLQDDDWVHVDSHHGRITVPVRLAGNVQPDTVWTWNAIGKRKGAWKLAAKAPESTQGFLLNHLISDITPRGDYANADPVTGQAAWFDLRVRIEKVSAQEASSPQFAALAGAPADAAPLRYGAAFRSKR